MKKTHCGRNSCLSGGIRRLISFGEEAELKAETRLQKLIVCLLLVKLKSNDFSSGFQKNFIFIYCLIRLSTTEMSNHTSAFQTDDCANFNNYQVFYILQVRESQHVCYIQFKLLIKLKHYVFVHDLTK